MSFLDYKEHRSKLLNVPQVLPGAIQKPLRGETQFHLGNTHPAGLPQVSLRLFTFKTLNP